MTYLNRYIDIINHFICFFLESVFSIEHYNRKMYEFIILLFKIILDVRELGIDRNYYVLRNENACKSYHSITYMFRMKTLNVPGG